MSTSPPGPRPLVVTADDRVLDDVLRVAELCGVGLEVAHDLSAARRAWSTAPLIMIGSDLAASLARSVPSRRPGVVLLARDRLDGLDHRDWQRAVEIGVDEVVSLPEQEAWLGQRLTDAVEGSECRAVVVGVVGGRGGAGASSLAVALGMVAHRDGLSTVLVDADPMSGGLDLALGGEDVTGVRWADLQAADGRISPRVLWDALPRPEGLPVVSGGREGPRTIPAKAMQAVLSATRRACDLVVVDLPRYVDEATEEALAQCSTTLLLVPAEIRAVAAARRVADIVIPLAPDVRVAVRGPAPAGLRASDVASTIGLPLAGDMPPELGLARRLERGEPPGRHGRGPLADFARRVLRDLGLRERRPA